MPSYEAVRRFERIAPLYDETREPLDPETFRGFLDALTRTGCASLLEVGVGTGRLARPLEERGVRITGVDAARAMLARARAKGLDRLARGDAYRLPFRDEAFDGTLFAHVLHVLDEPLRALAEAGRVSRKCAVALMGQRVRAGGPSEPAEGEEVREILREVFKRAGVPLNARAHPWEREQSLLADLPADGSYPVGERVVERTLSERLRSIERRADRSTLDAPPEVLAEAIAEVRRRLGERTERIRLTYTLVAWNSDRLRHLRLPAGPRTAGPGPDAGGAAVRPGR